MEMLTLIIALSAILWYLIDRMKPMWEGKAWSKYVTMAVAAIGGFGLAFGFDLDIVFACGLVEEASTLGTILTGFSLMSGSSAVSEIISKFKTPKQ